MWIMFLESADGVFLKAVREYLADLEGLLGVDEGSFHFINSECTAAEYLPMGAEPECYVAYKIDQFDPMTAIQVAFSEELLDS